MGREGTRTVYLAAGVVGAGVGRVPFRVSALYSFSLIKKATVKVQFRSLSFWERAGVRVPWRIVAAPS